MTPNDDDELDLAPDVRVRPRAEELDLTDASADEGDDEVRSEHPEESSSGDPESNESLQKILEPDQHDPARVVLPRQVSRGAENAEVGHLIGHDVVLDTRGELLYLGRLEMIGEFFYVLSEADVHDMSVGRTSKEIYILESFKYGLKKNRRRVYVRAHEVVSLSALADIIEY